MDKVWVVAERAAAAPRALLSTTHRTFLRWVLIKIALLARPTLFLLPVLTDGDWCSSPRPVSLWVKEARGSSLSQPITAAQRLPVRRRRPIGARVCHRKDPPLSNGGTAWSGRNVCVRKLKDSEIYGQKQKINRRVKEFKSGFKVLKDERAAKLKPSSLLLN